MADVVLQTYEALPQSHRPRQRQAAQEWVPLSGIVLSRGRHVPEVNDRPAVFRLI